jgi:hypothetical protein
MEERALSQVHAGETTAAEVRQLLGEPTEVESLGPGQELWVYRYVEYRGIYLPLVGPLSSGESREGVVKLYLQDNRVERLERSQTQRTPKL